MKNDTTITFLNFVLAVLVFLCVVFAGFFLWQTHELHQLQSEALAVQSGSVRIQALARDVVAYNSTAKSQELDQILQNALTAPAPAK